VKSRGKGGANNSMGPGPRGYPPSRPMFPQQPMQRRIIPSYQSSAVRRPIPKSSPADKEFSDVLKKLKEIGK
jgi:hypothetical protein